MADVEETIKRLSAHKGVTGVIVMDSKGRAIRSSMPDEVTAQHCAQFQQLAEKSRSFVQELDSTSEMQFLRLRTKKSAYMISADKNYTLMVIQNLLG